MHKSVKLCHLVLNICMYIYIVYTQNKYFIKGRDYFSERNFEKLKNPQVFGNKLLKRAKFLKEGNSTDDQI